MPSSGELVLVQGMGVKKKEATVWGMSLKTHCWEIDMWKEEEEK